jgi:murein DD-endopeptidase MepM/ murein hydrolase activator NlpD
MSLPKRSRSVAAQRTFPRGPLTLAFGILVLATAASLGPTRPGPRFSWADRSVEIPAIGDIDQQLAQKYFLLPAAAAQSEAAPPIDPQASDTQALSAPAHPVPAQPGRTQPPSSQPLPVQDDASSPAVEQVIQVAKGDTLMSVLTDAGVSHGQAQAAIAALSDVFSPRDLKPGQPIKLTLVPDDSAGSDASEILSPALQLVGLALQPSVERNVALSRAIDGSFSAESTAIPLKLEPARATGIIRSSLFEAGQAAGVPIPVMSDVIHAFSYDVDFQRDFQPGDRFEIVYERYLDGAGQLAKTGNVIFASLVLSGRELKLYRYALKDGRVEWFNPKGDSVRKALLRTPIDGAKITSGFGMRLHPILGYTTMHKGVDFGAPMGTPIFAAGDGVVAQIGPASGYGNYIRIKHNATYATAYGHISRFAGGLRAGSRVRQGQVIAYVGMTGRATGPHLHFEVLVNGQQINPQSVKLPTGEKLQGKELQKFLVFVANVNRQRHALGTQELVARSTGQVP